MNQRIRELVEQAGGNFGQGLEFAVVFGESEDFEKFAELLVRECSLTIWQNIVEAADSTRLDTAELETRLYKNWDRQIKQHFGVEL